MIILHIISGLGVGGAELMLKRLVLAQHGNSAYRHSVISLSSIGPVGQQLQELGIDVMALGMRTPLHAPRTLLRLVRQIKAIRPTVVQTWMYHADLLGGLAARIAGNRNIVWGIRTTDVTAGGSRATALVRKACAMLSSSVPHTIVCAAEASRWTHAGLGYAADRMTVVPNGFDMAKLVATDDQRSAARDHCGFLASDIVIGTLGRFHGTKNQENFVRAAGLLAEKNKHVRFLMVGRGLDAGNAQLCAWIKGTGYADSFVLVGERSDVPAWLSAMDIFCLSSRTEGFPNVVGEAMAMGVPCVVTDVGDAAILVDDTGIVVPRQNSVMLAQGLRKLVDMSATERRELGRRANARICEQFTIERCCERFEDVYKRVVGEGKR
jgi:glycosyltransferase involved in cell wall biosynthesis